MAVASDLPKLELRTARQLDHRRQGRPRARRPDRQPEAAVRARAQIAPVMKHAIIAIEDRRFYTNEGVDLRGIGRALYQDVVQKKVVQGGSTITQQFVKNALAAQDDRTLFQKLREAALAYHLTRKWSKERILATTSTRSTSATAPTASRRPRGRTSSPTTRAATSPATAELRAPSSRRTRRRCSPAWSRRPSGYDPIAHPRRRASAATSCSSACSSRASSRARSTTPSATQPMPDQGDLQPPVEDGEYPYFTSWIKQQVVDRLGGGQEGARQAFEGGLRDHDHDRRRAPAGRRGRDQQLAAESRRPARGARGDREQDRQGARDGRRRRDGTTSGRSTSPRRASASPARRSSRSSSPRRCGRASPPTRCGPRKKLDDRRAALAGRCSPSTTTRTPTPAAPRSRARRRSPTTPCSPRSASRSARARSPAWRSAWASGRRSRTTTR